MPGEWETQKSVWLIWPYNEKDWPKLFKKIPDVVGKISACLSINQNVNLIIRNLKDISRIKILRTYGNGPAFARNTAISFSEASFLLEEFADESFKIKEQPSTVKIGKSSPLCVTT